MDSDLCIGVALSSGSAAGMAHIGVLEELAAAGIPIQAVAGTSAGALVGAAYAAGQLAGLRHTMAALTRRRVLRLLDPVWPRSGIFEGRRAMELVRPHVGERIEALGCAYAAIATELRTGEEIVLRQGSVIDAIRASIAIPGVFTPRVDGGRVLVDGGLVDPIPVGVARRLGAEFVIAVSVVPIDGVDAASVRSATSVPAEPGAAAGTLHERLRLLDVVLEASRLVEARIAASRLRDEPADWLLSVPVHDVGLFDFHRSEEMVEAGRAAARAALPALRAALAAARPRRRLPRWPRLRRPAAFWMPAGPPATPEG